MTETLKHDNEELIDQIDELTDRVEELERLLLKFVDHYNTNILNINGAFSILERRFLDEYDQHDYISQFDMEDEG